MKVLAVTSAGYLIEASDHELAMVAGEYVHAPAWRDHPARGVDKALRVGTMVDVGEAYRFLVGIKNSEEAVQKGAATLRALADLIERSQPSVLIAPKDPT